MKKTSTLLTIVFSISLITNALADERISFINDNLTTAMNQASSQGKLIFLDFYASYCSPCRLMEEYTFTDPSVIERMNAAYVPVKINIENFDGYDLKNQFNVKVLPTLIVLDSKGRLVGRYEESMTGSRLATVLAKHDVDKNRNKYAPTTTGTGYTGFSSTNTARNYATTAPTVTTKPTTTPTNTAPGYRPINAAAPSVSNVKPSATVPNNYNYTSPNSTKLKPLPPSDNPLLDSRKLKKAVFTIQVGIFSNEKNAKALGDALGQKLGTTQRVFMLKSDSTKSGVLYRVFVGNFSSRQLASDFRTRHGFEGFIQDYANFNH